MGASIDSVTDVDTWNRLDGEGDVAYASFKAWVASGLESEDGLRRKRTMEKVAVVSRVDPGILARWKEQYFWEARAKAYDLYIAQVKGAALARRSSLYVEAQTDLAAVCAIEARRMLDAVKRGDSVLTGKDLVKTLESLVKLDRLSQGLSTDNVAVNVTDMSKLSDEEAELMHAMLLKAGG